MNYQRMYYLRFPAVFIRLDEAARRYRTKRKGEVPFEISPLTIRFFEDLVRCPDHNSLSLRSCPEPSGGARASRTFRHSIRCKSFLVPSAAASFPSASRASFLIPLRVSFPMLFRSSFPGSLASPASGSPGVPFPALLRVPLPVPLMALVFSLLLENRSSVELKDTRNFDDCNGVGTLYFCGK
jgi:hypothetical protein